MRDSELVNNPQQLNLGYRCQTQNLYNEKNIICAIPLSFNGINRNC